MKESKLFPTSIFIWMITLFVIGCSKQGPAGATGPQGPAGPTGASGTTGLQGDTGTANVIYSAWNNTFTGTIGYWNVPEITENIVDSGVVLVYINDQNGNIYQLNYTIGSFYVVYSLQVGAISLLTSDNLRNYSFRYVIVPGAVASPSSIPKDYKLMCAKFHLSQD